MSDEYTEDYISKAPKAFRGLDCWRKRVQDCFIALPSEGRLYSIGLAVIGFAGVVSLFKRHDAWTLVQVGAVVFAFGLLPLIAIRYEWVWKNLFGKLILAGLIALATNIAYGFGRQIVANLIGTSPEPFTATVNIATILLSPILILFAVAIGGFFILLFACYAGLLALTTLLHFPGNGKCICLWLFRFAALAIAVFGSLSVVNHSAGYTGWVSRRSAQYLYTFDMYRDEQFETNKVEKFALLPNSRLLVGAPKDGGGYTFVVRYVRERAIPHDADPK